MRTSSDAADDDSEAAALLREPRGAPAPRGGSVADHFERLTRGFAAELRPAAATSTGDALRRKADGYRALERALEEMGAGRFQYRLLALTAFGHFVEAAESALLGVLLPVLSSAFNDASESDLALIGSLTAVGCMVGALVFAQLSNTWGRRASYQVSLGLCVAFGLASSFADSLLAFALLRLLFGIGYGGNLVASSTLLVEFTPAASRGLFMTACGLAFGVGAIFSVALSWAVVPKLGWRWLIRIVSCVSVPTLLALPCVPESPRFHLMRGRTRAAIDALQRVAAVNGVELPRCARSESDLLVRGPSEMDAFELARRETCVPWASLARAAPSLAPLALLWFSHSFAATIFWFVPLEIQKRSPGEQSVKYQVSLVMAAGGLLGCVALMGTSRYLGRLVQLRWSLLLTAALTVALAFNEASSAYVYAVAFVLEVVSQVPISMLYLYTPEAHPTDVRTLAFGLCQFCHRLAPIMAPFAVAALDASSSFSSACIAFGCIFAISFVLSFALRRETFGRGLVEDDDYAEDEAAEAIAAQAYAAAPGASPVSVFERLFRGAGAGRSKWAWWAAGSGEASAAVAPEEREVAGKRV